jgi:molybdopterin converting factor small subunit
VAVIFHIPAPLRSYTSGASRVEISATPTTLRDALEVLWTLYPGIRDRVVNEQGQIREHVNVFVGNEEVRYTGGLATALSAGAEISIVPAISGGVSPSR